MIPLPDNRDHRLQTALWLAIGLSMAWLFYFLAPVLTPFLLAGIFAYIGNPLVDRLQQFKVPRLAATLLVLLLMVALLAGVVLILVPLLLEEASLLIARLPDGLALANQHLAPWLAEHFDLRLALDQEALKNLLTDNWGSVQTLGSKVLASLKIGGVALVGLLANLFLVPVVMFYLLLDWHSLLSRLDGAIPRAWHAKVRTLAGGVDAVLSEFLRGQLLVMIMLAAYYSLALAIVGLPSALAIGLLTGLLVFVPYLGYATGFGLALLVAVLQFQGLPPVIGVLIVFGVGQALESFILTPYLVGNRIGLHPLAVIFALMAFGQLFGFFGILLALPASAALLIGLRELRQQYLTSSFYLGRQDPPQP
jgi:predicted PurR-regulated permease PerM